jgi:hypothetical protein
MSETLGLPVPPGSTVSGLAAGLARDFMVRMDALESKGLWSEELQRRFDAVESLPDNADEQHQRERVDALLFELARVERENSGQ